MVSPNNPNLCRMGAGLAGVALGLTALTSCGNAIPPDPETVPMQVALVEYKDPNHAFLLGCFRYKNAAGDMSVGTISFTQESDTQALADGLPFAFHPFMLHGQSTGLSYEGLLAERVERPLNNSLYYAGETFPPKVPREADGRYKERLQCLIPVNSKVFTKEMYGDNEQFVTVTNSGGTAYKATGPFNESTKVDKSTTTTKVGKRTFNVEDYAFTAPPVAPQKTR